MRENCILRVGQAGVITDYLPHFGGRVDILVDRQLNRFSFGQFHVNSHLSTQRRLCQILYGSDLHFFILGWPSKRPLGFSTVSVLTS